MGVAKILKHWSRCCALTRSKLRWSLAVRSQHGRKGLRRDVALGRLRDTAQKARACTALPLCTMAVIDRLLRVVAALAARATRIVVAAATCALALTLALVHCARCCRGPEKLVTNESALFPDFCTSVNQSWSQPLRRPTSRYCRPDMRTIANTISAVTMVLRKKKPPGARKSKRIPQPAAEVNVSDAWRHKVA